VVPFDESEARFRPRPANRSRKGAQQDRLLDAAFALWRVNARRKRHARSRQWPPQALLLRRSADSSVVYLLAFHRHTERPQVVCRKGIAWLTNNKAIP
jgi:hypothetical protein